MVAHTFTVGSSVSFLDEVDTSAGYDSDFHTSLVERNTAEEPSSGS